MAAQTRGFCKYCGKEYTKAGMAKHLTACKERKSILAAAKGKDGCYELMVYGKYNSDYWLIVQIKDTATLKDLDKFIRDIWVECCGHLSAFDISGQLYESMPSADSFWGEPPKSMVCKLKNVLSVGMLLGYEYDYGSTTELSIKVLDHMDNVSQKDKVVILSRNNPPDIVCSVCGKNPAEWVDPTHIYDENAFWCEACMEAGARKDLEEDMAAHEGDEFVEFEFEIPEYFLPVCNSPRMGVCGYEGSNRYPDQFVPDKK